MSGIVISGDTRGGVGGPAPRKAPAAGAYKAAVGGVLTKLQQAWNANKPGAVGGLFGKEADYVTIAGVHISGNEKIAAAHKQLFDAQKGSQSAYRIIKMKPLAPDVVMAFLGQKITMKGADGKEQAITTRPTMTLRKVGNDWKIVAFQVTRAGPAARGGGGGAKAAAAKPAAAAKADDKGSAKAAAPAKKADKK